MKIVNFRVEDAEHETMRAIADAECMTLSAYIRRHFQMEARRLGLAADPLAGKRKEAKAAEEARANPPVERLPIPRNGNLWGHTMLQRSEAGEPVTTIAASYGVAVPVVQTQIADAKRRRAEGNDAHTWGENPEPTAPTPPPSATKAGVDWDNIGPSDPVPSGLSDEEAMRFRELRMAARERMGAVEYSAPIKAKPYQSAHHATPDIDWDNT